MLVKFHGTPSLKRFIRFSKGANGKRGGNIERVLQRTTCKNGERFLLSQGEVEIDWGSFVLQMRGKEKLNSRQKFEIKIENSFLLICHKP